MTFPRLRIPFLTIILTFCFSSFGWAQIGGEERIRALGESLIADPDWKYPIIDAALTCEQATHVSHRAVERLGYKIAAFTPATAERTGEIKGLRTGVWGEEEPVTVTITCPADGPHIEAHPVVSPCEQGNRISRLAAERQGYRITEFTPATLGKAGSVKGEKKGEPPLVISLFCARNNGVVMETNMDSPALKKDDFYLAISDFERGFFAMFKGERSLLGAEQTPVASNQLRITMRPLSPVESQIIFNTEIKAILPVRIEITNPTKRSYQVAADEIVLLSAAGKRIKPLSGKETPFPTPAFASKTVAPKSGVKGYLYFPPGVYKGARGALVEEQSQEREGFEVQF